MQLVHLAFRQGDDPHAVEAHALKDVGDVLLVPGDAVQRFGEDDVDLTGGGVLQELLDAGSDQAGARDGLVDVALTDRPFFLGGVLLAHAKLILDRGLALQV